jgi:transposase
VLWTGCQWKAVHREGFGLCSSTVHQRFQEGQRAGVFLKIMMLMVKFYARRPGIGWLGQAIDSKRCPAPLGGSETGKSPVDRSQPGSKIQLLVDEGGAPLSLCLTGAQIHDQGLADDLMIAMVVPRPDPEQVEPPVCRDQGYDYPDVHQFVQLARDIVPIQRRRRRGEPVVEDCPIPGQTQFPARRWGVEPTRSWLAQRRSLRVRWCKQADNWLGLIQLACSHILMDMSVYG